MKNRWFGRRIFIPFICVALLFAAGESLAQPKLHNVTLTTLIKTKGETADRTATFEQKEARAIDTMTEGKSYTYTLTATLKNAGSQQENVQLEWYFLSRNRKGNAGYGKREVPVRGVFQAGKKKVPLDVDAEATETIVSKSLVFKKVTIDTFNESTGDQYTVVKEKGDTYLGYLVLVTVDGKIIARDASSYRYLKDEWVEKCRSYKPKGKGRR